MDETNKPEEAASETPNPAAEAPKSQEQTLKQVVSTLKESGALDGRNRFGGTSYSGPSKG